MLAVLRLPAIPLALLISGSFYYFVAMSLIDVHPFPAATGIFYGTLCAWSLAAVWLNRKEVDVKIDVADIIFIILLATIIVSTVGHSLMPNLKHIKFLPFFMIVPYVCSRILTQKQIIILIKISVWCAAVALLVIGAQLILRPQFYGDRPLLFGYNHLGVLSSILLGSLAALIIAHVLRPGVEPRLLLFQKAGLVFLPLVIAAMMYLGGRGGTAAFILCASFILFSAVFFGIRKKILISLSIYILLCVSLVFTLLPKNQSEFFVRAAQDMRGPGLHSIKKQTTEPKGACQKIQWAAEHGHSIEVRKLLYGAAFSMAGTAPMFGIGAGMFGERLCNDEAYFPHSTILQALAELGVWGCALLLGVTLLAGNKLLHIVFDIGANPNRRITAWLLLSLGVFYFLIDQIYGDYFTSIAVYILIGTSVALATNQSAHSEST